MLNLKPETKVKLGELHVKHFKKLKNHPNARVSECDYYLSLWEDVVANRGEFLFPEQEAEIGDAVLSGEYDDLLKECGEYVPE